MDWWRHLLIDRRLILALAVALLAVHLVWTYHSRNGADLARCGALWAILAGVLIARPVIRLGFSEWLRQTRTIDAGEFGNPEVEAAQAEEERQVSIDLFNVQIAGPALLVAGTLLWGYGDLLGSRLFPMP